MMTIRLLHSVAGKHFVIPAGTILEGMHHPLGAEFPQWVADGVAEQLDPQAYREGRIVVVKD